MRRLKKGISLTGLYLLAGLVTIVIVLIALKLNGIAPFGPHTILRDDLDNQYVSYLAYLKRHFGDWSKFLYSNNMTLGGDMFGLTTYYLLSPFNFFVFLFSYAQLPIAIVWITVCKNAAATMTMLALVRYYRRRYDLQLNVPIQLMLALAWGLSGWMLNFSLDIMWQDPVILMPLVVIGVEHYIEHTRWAWYAITLALCLLINYYIGYMIGLFLVHFFLLRMVAEWQLHGWHFKKIAWRTMYFGLISIVTVGLTWIVIWPTLKSLQGVKGTRAYQFTFQTRWYPNRAIGEFFNLTYTNHSLTGTGPMVYMGVIVMVAAVAFFFVKKIPGIVRFATGVTFALLFLESFIRGTDVAWHGFTAPIGMSNRWAFVFDFFLLMMAIFALGRLRLTRRFLRNMLLLTFLVTFLVIYRQLRLYQHQVGVHYNQFTSLSFVYNALAVGLTALALYWYIGHPQIRRYTGLLVALVGMADLAVTTYWSYANQPDYYSLKAYQKETKEYQQLVDWVKQHDRSNFFRMDEDYFRNKNDSMAYDFYGLSHYSSSQPLSIDNFMGHLGYQHSLWWTSYNSGSTHAADSLFGVKYVIDAPNSVTNHGSQLFANGLKPIHRQDGFTVYQNPDALKVGVLAPTTKAIKKTDTVYTTAYPSNVSRIFADLTGEKQFEQMSFIMGGVSKVKKDPEKRTMTYQVPGRDNLPIYTNVVLDKLFTGDMNATPEVDVYVEGHKVAEDFTMPERGIISLGHWPRGTKKTITFKVRNYPKSMRELGYKVSHLPNAAFYVEHTEVLKQAVAKINSQSVDLKQLNSTAWDGSVTTKRPSQSLILTLPYDKGWRVTVDGKRVPLKQYLEFMRVDLKDKGTHRVHLQYIDSSLGLGLRVSVLAGLGLIELLIIQAFTVWGWRIRNRHLERRRKAAAPVYDPYYFDYH